MTSFLNLLCIYILGGLTFLPLALGAVLLHAYLTFPTASSTPSSADADDEIHRASDDGQNLASGAEAIARRIQGDQEKDVAEGYFAVCREYVPGGINGKPPVRTTPAGSAIAAESPSVYQSMYRSLFERKQATSLEAGKAEASKANKRARNVFYVVLRHGHLMLYDDSEQVEVRHVISLAHHDVGVYGGGDEIPESELWIKRNAISLRRKAATQDQGSITLPFFFFSENCSEKEDFYFALLRSQDRENIVDSYPPQVQHFEVKDIISLVQRLHSSEEHLQTRWLNALVGRLFLALYKTRAAEEFIRMKITKKIARVKKPAFLSGIVLNKISLGNSAPFLTNPKLRDLTVDGEYCAEAHLKYEGNFRLEIAATARIDLGTRFKAREVNLVLAVVVKKLEGQLLVRLKPPPSNRIWVTFETMPQLEMSIESIVSSRQITYSIILRAIESRIREVLAETLVLPHWDDSPFLDTTQELFRGGIWVNEGYSSQQDHGTAIPDEIPEDESDLGHSKDASPTLKPLSEDRSASIPALAESLTETGITRRGHGHKPGTSLSGQRESSISSSIQRSSDVPRVMRSHSFATAADPIVSTNSVNGDANKTVSKKPTSSKDAASFMTEISNRSQPSSPLSTPAAVTSPAPFERKGKSRNGSQSSVSSIQASRSDASGVLHDNRESFHDPARSISSSEEKSTSTKSNVANQQATRFQAVTKSLTPSEKKQQAIATAATAAKNWGWNALNRKSKPQSSTPPGEKVGTPENPMGRGRPLPPPGQPLPLPDKRRTTTSLTLPKRKPVPSASSVISLNSGRSPQLSPATQGGHRRASSLVETKADAAAVMVVEAPDDHGSTSSAAEDDHDGYGEFIDNVNVDDDEEDEKVNDGPASAQATDKAETRAVQVARSPSVTNRPLSSPLSSSYEDDDEHGLASWRVAQEEEARSKSVWMDEQEHS